MAQPHGVHVVRSRVLIRRPTRRHKTEVVSETPFPAATISWTVPRNETETGNAIKRGWWRRVHRRAPSSRVVGVRRSRTCVHINSPGARRSPDHVRPSGPRRNAAVSEGNASMMFLREKEREGRERFLTAVCVVYGHAPSS